MSGGSKASSDYYYLPNVPNVMYFYEEYALHGTYWHRNFGQPMSRGCVNLSLPDAQWFFNWAEIGTPVASTISPCAVWLVARCAKRHCRVVDPKTAAGKSEYKGQMYYFCSQGCTALFDKSPEKFVGAPQSQHGEHHH